MNPALRILLLGGGPFTPQRLFRGNEQGFFFVNDISTMYQDSAGTTPAALEQPVGLWLDSRFGAARGSEQCVNGDFANGTANWTQGANTTFTVTGGQALIENSTAAVATISQNILTSGEWYEITLTKISAVSSTGAIQLGTTRVSMGSGNGAKRFIAQANGATFSIDPNTGQAGGNVVVDDVSVRRLPGNHATQPTSANRMTATTDSGYQVESLDGLDDYIATSDGGQGTTGFLLCMALKVGKVGAVQTLLSDAGTNTGYRVRLNASNQLEIAAGNGTAFTTAATSDTVALSGSYVLTAWHDGATLNAQINSGGIGSASFSAASAGTAAVTIGRDNGAASNYTQGKIAQAVYVKNSIVTATVREQVKRYMASRLGVAL